MSYLNDSAILIDSNLTQNITEEYALPDSVTYTLIGLDVVLVSTGLIGNGLILIYYLFIRKAKTNATYFLVALAVSDMLLIIWCVPFKVFSNLINYHLIFGHLMCSSVNYIQTACVIHRSCTLVASSIDRYFAIRWPLKEKASSSVVAIIIFVIWIVSLILPLPVAIFTNMKDVDESANSSSVCLKVWSREDFRQGFSITLLIITYFIPLLVLVMTYGHIVLILDVKPPGEEYEQLLRRRRAVKRKTIKMLLLAFSAYAICWLPIHTITIVGDVSPQIYDSKLVRILWLFAQCLAVSNSAINPVIVLSSDSKLQKLMKTKCCSPNYSRRGSRATLKSVVIRMVKRRSTQETCV